MKIRSIPVLLLGVVLTGALVSACGSNFKQVPSQPMPPGVSFNGEWYSPEYEQMKLEQAGSKVTGTFAYRTGGTIEGELEGNVLYFRWVQPGDMSKARREVSGHGYIVLAPDGNTFEGEWGYGEDNTGGGAWTGERIGVKKESDFDPDEPVFDRN